MSSTLPQTATSHATQAALEARFSVLVAAALTRRSQALPHDLSERLRFARKQAGSRARLANAKTAGGTALAGVSAGGSGVLAGFQPWWQRVASVLPLLMLVAGMLMAERWSVREHILAAAEIDAQLLSDALPPSAYSDPGFGEYLRNPPAP